MARTFGSYSPSVPLGVTWEESLILEDQNSLPIDLTGYAVRAQIYAAPPIRNPVTGIATVAPVLEITSVGWYSTLPTWPVVAGASIPSPATQGLVTTAVKPIDLWTLSTSNVKTKYYWSVVLTNPGTGYSIPVIEGRLVVLPARTI